MTDGQEKSMCPSITADGSSIVVTTFTESYLASLGIGGSYQKIPEEFHTFFADLTRKTVNEFF